MTCANQCVLMETNLFLHDAWFQCSLGVKEMFKKPPLNILMLSVAVALIAVVYILAGETNTAIINHETILTGVDYQIYRATLVNGMSQI